MTAELKEQYHGKSVKFTKRDFGNGNIFDGVAELSAKGGPIAIVVNRRLSDKDFKSITSPLTEDEVKRLKPDGKGGFLLV
jgi:hypothetical protein